MDEELGDAKDGLRRTAMKKILSMTEEQRRNKSFRITSRIKELKEFSRARCIMVYVSKSDEVDTTELMEDMLRSGKRVVVPVVDREKEEIVPCEIKSLNELRPRTFGVMEPRLGEARTVNVEEIDLAIVPGRAFDKDCNRLGRGRGYFDRFLKKLGGRVKVIGVAFSEQLFDSIPVGERDVKVDIVVTESGVIRRSVQEQAAHLRENRVSTRKLAASSLFTALFFVLRAIPTFPIIGVSGGRFTVSDMLPAFYGALLGPINGAVVVLLGTVLGFMVNPPKFLFLDFLPPMVNVLIAGFLWRRKILLSLSIYFSALIAFVTGPFTLLLVNISLLGGEVALPFHWLHFTAVPVSLALAELGVKKKGASAVWRRFLGCVFLGTMGQHSVGSTLFEYVYGYTGMLNREGFFATWYTVFWIYPVERVLLVLASTMIGAPLILALDRITGWFQNPS
ncbi:MAG: 5-formyltetrahydrofolate cyclo-ligase [Thermoproteota archaeon]